MTSDGLAVGTTLADRYEIVAELHRSSTARVYRATDRKLRRAVAVKVLRAELVAAVSTQRFLRGIALTAPLHHPHILPIFDAGEAGRIVYYVSPLIEGESLEAELRRCTRVPLGTALALAGEVADALAYAHEHGVVHRDIAPRNILLDAGHAVVADFGVARAVADAGQDRITPTGIMIGSPGYMSPEQARAETVDGRADIYALGCVLFEMLAGRPPFPGATADAIRRLHLEAPIPSIRPAQPEVPDWVDAALTRAMAKRPADRFPTAAEFARALRHDRA